MQRVLLLFELGCGDLSIPALLRPFGCAQGLRLIRNDEGQLGLGIDVEQEGDNVVEFEGTKVLLVEEGLAVSLVGLTMDVEETAEGPKLVLNKD